ncbi:MAG: pantoate--beta-alanine ligase [Planctomycetaceae bacterium]|jgi:pantoate--beta-alanine ligase|nr:pantoate--beta-alanine ligase [Planctomycetaceae bacterium]
MLTTIDELRNWSNEQHAAGLTVGFVPTMGALHEGHLSLVKAANERCDKTVVSVFVNPAQFAPNEDFHKYPRPLENDLKVLKSAGAPEVFVPSVAEMYPDGFDASVHIGGVSQPFEGQFRPVHFSGVATVVLKLFNAGQADIAFFGQKDYQQVCVVRKMVSDLNVPVKIAVCPIVREPDGLAMSSRNRYLSAEHRRQAVVLSRSLAEAERLISVKKEQKVKNIVAAMTKTICTDTDFTVDYAAVADPETLRELDIIDPLKHSAVVILLAAKIGTTRLIDNAVIEL